MSSEAEGAGLAALPVRTGRQPSIPDGVSGSNKPDRQQIE